MDWYKMAVFIYCAALTHFVADFLTHGRKKGKFIILHCFLYTLFFIPLFWWQEINFWWLPLLFFSHLIIDLGTRPLRHLFQKIMKEADEKETTLTILVLGIDQVLHLIIPLIIALFG